MAKAWTKCVSAVAALMLMCAGVSAGTTAAMAAGDVEGEITHAEFQNTTITDGSYQRLDIRWEADASGATGVKLEIAFPAGLSSYDTSFRIFEGGGAGVDAGECVVSATGAVCTLDPVYVAGHQRHLTGTFHLNVLVHLQTTEETTKTFEIGDVTTPEIKVIPPGPVGPCTVDCEFPGTGSYKYGRYISSNNTIEWEVYVKTPPEGLPVGTEMRVTDNINPNLFEIIGEPVVYQARHVVPNSNNYEYPFYVQLDRAKYTVSDGGKTVDLVTEAGAGATAIPPARGLAGSVYYVKWTVKVLDGGREGIYTNTARWSLGTTTTETVTASVTEANGGGTVVADGFGKFRVLKQIIGNDGAAADSTFKLKWTVYDADDVNDPGTVTVSDLPANGSFTSPDIPEGSRVTVEELDPASTVGGQWDAPTFRETDVDGRLLPGAGTSSVTFEIPESAGATGTVVYYTLQNSYIGPAVPTFGKFTVAKVVKGTGAELVPADVMFSGTYAYPAGSEYPAGNGTWQVAAGKTWTSGDIPAGAVVTVRENDPEAVAGATWGVTPADQSVTIVADAVGALSFTNIIQAEPVEPKPPTTPPTTPPTDPKPPTKPTTPPSGKELARSGGDALGLSVAAFVLLLGGAALTLQRRKSPGQTK